jgi:hypothetical protein
MNDLYYSRNFIKKLESMTFCGENAWKRLLSWLEVDEPFKEFMKLWSQQIEPFLFSDVNENNLPEITGILEPHFENMYPAQFILRIAQLADESRRLWILSALNDTQKKILTSWIEDCALDTEKAWITDHWTDILNSEEFSYQGIPLFDPIKSEIFSMLSFYHNNRLKCIR